MLYPLVLEPLYAAISKICGKSINKNILNENSNKKHYFTNKLPIVYSKQYNITAFGIEKMHPFDASKYEKSKLILICYLINLFLTFNSLYNNNIYFSI